MKKIVALMLVLMVALFAGCAGNEATEKPREEREEKKTTSVKEKENTSEKQSKKENTKNQESEEDEEEQIARVKIDGIWLDLIGRNSSSIAAIKGEMSESIWEDGPLYRFGSDNVWYGFDGYDFAEDNSYIPLGSCNSIAIPLNMLLEGEDVCNAQVLEEAAGKTLTQGFDAMYECNTYAVSYRGYRFVIYENSLSGITGQSVVNVRKEQ